MLFPTLGDLPDPRIKPSSPMAPALAGELFATEPPGKPKCYMCAKSLQLCPTATLWTVACQALLSVGFSRQEYWSGLPCSPPGDLPNPEIKYRSPGLLADSLLSESPGKPMNTGACDLSLLQGIFPTHKLNQGLLHHRWIFQQLS